MEKEIEYLPFEVDETRLGTLVTAKECCPGVYYLATKRDKRLFCDEYYAVVENYDGKAISKETIFYGKLSNGAYYFEYGRDNSGWDLVEFELLRYQIKYGTSVWGLTDDDLYCRAIYAAELYPDYFGSYIPPRLTPYGQTLRYKTVTNGIYFLETDQCVWLLAICYPIWEGGISDVARCRGKICKETQALAGEQFNYLFFTADCCASVIYELSQMDHVYYEGFMQFIASDDELVAAMWETCPEYIITHNYLEQAGQGRGNYLDRLLSEFGVEPGEEEDEDMEYPTTNCIVYNPNVSGKSYLLLP